MMILLRLTREQPLTFLEFNYMLLQAYDFLGTVIKPNTNTNTHTNTNTNTNTDDDRIK